MLKVMVKLIMLCVCFCKLGIFYNNWWCVGFFMSGILISIDGRDKSVVEVD